MLLTSSMRITRASVRNVNTIRSCLCPVLKHCVFFSPILNPGTKEACFTRQYRQQSVLPDVIEDHLEKDDPKYMYKKLPRKENIKRLMEFTGCSVHEAQSMIKEYPLLKYISTAELKRKIQFLNDKGISSEDIVKNYSILCLTDDEIEQKLEILAKVGACNNNHTSHLLSLPINRLQEAASWALHLIEPNKTKISVISDKLKCDPAEIAVAVTIHKFLQTVPFERMTATLDILLAEGVPASNILRDMWVIRYSVGQVERRVSQAKEGGIKQFKTWMVRCTEKILINTIRIQAEKRALLGPHNYSTVDYVSSRLKLNREDARLILERQPQLKGVGAAKLCNTFDFLLGKEEKGAENANSDDSDAGDDDVVAKFDPEQVWSSSRALCHSVETMKTRLSRLRAIGYEPKNPNVLYKSRRKFEEFVEKLKEKKALAEKSEGELENMEPAIKETSEASQSGINR